MEQKEFKIIPAGKKTYISAGLIIFSMLLVNSLILYTIFSKQNKIDLGSSFAIGILTLILLFLIALFVFFCYSAKKTRFIITEEGLSIKGNLYGKGLRSSSLIPEEIEVINIKKDNSYRPGMRTNGIGLPGYSEGWYRLQNKEKALCFLTKLTNVVILPTAFDYSILMSIENPLEFLEAAKKFWTIN